MNLKKITKPLIASMLSAAFLSGCQGSVSSYNIKFLNWDGALLQESKVKKGDTPVYSGEDPTREASESATYVWSGWEPEIAPAAKDMSYTAKFNEVKNSLTVTFDSDGGTSIASQIVEYGEKAKRPENPFKTPTDSLEYAFEDWYLEDDAFDFSTPITANITLKAHYLESPRTYTVSFDSDGGTSIPSQKVKRGETATKPNDPAKESTVDATFAFSYWYLDDEEAAFDFSTPITENIILTALYDENVRKYTVTFIEHDGNVFDSQQVEYGELPSYPENDPSGYEDEDYFYTFSGWDKELETVKGDATYTAVYSKNHKPYNVTLKNVNLSNADETCLVEGGKLPEAPKMEGYVFSHWADENGEKVESVESNTTLVAHWLAKDIYRASSIFSPLAEAFGSEGADVEGAEDFESTGNPNNIFAEKGRKYSSLTDDFSIILPKMDLTAIGNVYFNVFGGASAGDLDLFVNDVNVTASQHLVNSEWIHKVSIEQNGEGFILKTNYYGTQIGSVALTEAQCVGEESIVLRLKAASAVYRFFVISDIKGMVYDHLASYGENIAKLSYDESSEETKAKAAIDAYNDFARQTAYEKEGKAISPLIDGAKAEITTFFGYVPGEDLALRGMNGCYLYPSENQTMTNPHGGNADVGSFGPDAAYNGNKTTAIQNAGGTGNKTNLSLTLPAIDYVGLGMIASLQLCADANSGADARVAYGGSVFGEHLAGGNADWLRPIVIEPNASGAEISMYYGGKMLGGSLSEEEAHGKTGVTLTIEFGGESSWFQVQLTSLRLSFINK